MMLYGMPSSGGIQMHCSISNSVVSGARSMMWLLLRREVLRLSYHAQLCSRRRWRLRCGHQRFRKRSSEEVFLSNSYCVITLRLAYFSSKFLDSVTMSANVALSEVKSFTKSAIRNLVSSTFDHDNLGFVTDVDEIKITVFTLSKVGFTMNSPSTRPTRTAPIGACEGNVRDSKGQQMRRSC